MVDEDDERLVRVARAATRLRRASGRLQRRLRAEGRHGGGPASAGEDLSPGRSSVLGNLARRGPMTPSDLAAADGVRPQSMTRTLAELERDGFVSRAADPDDARRLRIGITEAGSDALVAEAGARDGWLARAMTLELSPVERQVLVLAADLMERLADVPRPVPSGAASPGATAARAVPILPTHDSALTAAFFERLGFARSRGSEAGYVMLERGNLEIHYQLNADVDPFRTAAVAFVSVPDADAFRAEILAAGVVAPFAAGEDALRARWAATHDLSRVGAIEDKPWRVREFALADPTNNLLRIGHPIGLNRRRAERRDQPQEAHS